MDERHGTTQPRSSGQGKSEDPAPLLGRQTKGMFQRVLHLPPFPARTDLGQSHHADFVILRVNTRGKKQPTNKKPNKNQRIPLQSCQLAVWHGAGQGPDQPGSQGLLAIRGQRSIWAFPRCRRAPGATEGRGPRAGSPRSLPARQLPAPAPRESAAGGAHAAAFLCQPACVSTNAELSCSSSQLIMAREE